MARTRLPLSDASPLTRRAETEVLARFGTRDVLVTTKGGLLVCVIPASGDGVVDQLARLLQETVGERVGLGRSHAGPSGIVHFYEEAREALELAARLGLDDQVVAASNLLVYRVLLRDRGAIAELVAEVLQPFQQARGGAEPLIATLEGYFATGAVSVATAQRLHVRSARSPTGWTGSVR